MVNQPPLLSTTRSQACIRVIKSAIDVAKFALGNGGYMAAVPSGTITMSHFSTN